MKSTKQALTLGLIASLLAASALNAATYYIGSAAGALNNTTGANPLGGALTRDGAAIAPTAIWDLSTAPVDSVTGEKTVVLDANDTFILVGTVFVINGTLKIPGGTIIRGMPASSSTAFDVGSLAIARTAKIVADGSVANPIIFTTASLTGVNFLSAGQPVIGTAYTKNSASFWDANPFTAPRPLVTAGVKANGLWGGLMLCGNAPTNVDRNLTTGGTSGAYNDGNRLSLHEENPSSVGAAGDDRSSIEGIPTTSLAYTSGVDRFGGNQPLDNSGVLRYVSLRYCGSNFSANSEINGVTFGAVGAGTVVDYVEVFGCTDDTFEWFGGTVNCKHLVSFGSEDDCFDFDAGYSGFVQFALGVSWGFTGSTDAAADYTDRLVEWDGSYRQERPEGFRSVPQASPAIVAGGNAGCVATNQYSGGNTLINATLIANGYSGPTAAIATSSGASNNERGRGLMIRDQAVPHFLNSIVLSGAYGLRVATMGTEDQSATIKRLESGQAEIKNNTFYKTGLSTATAFVGTGYANTTAGSNNDLRVDVSAARVVAAAGFANNTFNTDPGFILTLNEACTTGTLDPRPLQGFGGVARVPVGAGMDDVTFRGAFSDDAFSDLWTTGWTAANKLGLIAN